MRKAQDHVLQQRRTRYTRYDRESLRKPSERKGYCKKGQRREGKGGNTAKKIKSKGGKDWIGREVAKVNKTKSGQSTDEFYASSWIHFDCLSFLLPVIKSSKSTDTLKRKNEEENEEVEETSFSKPGLKKKIIAERKIELLSKCTEAVTKKPVKSADSKHYAFALYADEKLS